MPRISPSVLRYAHSISPDLARLLPVCRELSSARNELRWLQAHAESAPNNSLSSLVARRARGEPLQYILGSEYFGELEILCRPGVLIPRQETAASVSYLVRSTRRLLPWPKIEPLRVLDACSGTGCIPLLFHHEFYHSQLYGNRPIDFVGLDISDTALDLATANKQQQLNTPWLKEASTIARTSLANMSFVKADVLDEGPAFAMSALATYGSSFDVLISNPPYISRRHYTTITSPSVRKYEPKLALVPSDTEGPRVEDGDQFYPRLWQIADQVRARVVLFEVGDADQAARVADMGRRHSWDEIELWRDNPASSTIENGRYRVNGEGNVRSVFARRFT